MLVGEYEQMATKRLTIALMLALAGCSGGGNAGTTQLIAEAEALRPELVEAKANELSQTDFAVFRRLMAVGGLDDELGGAPRGEAALRGLMVKYRQSLLGAKANEPRLIKASGGGDAPGFLGIGASMFAGMLVTTAAIKVAGDGGQDSGKIGSDGKDGSFSGEFDQSHVSTESTFKGEMDGMTGRITTKVTLETCPKPDGALNLEFLSDSSLTKTGGTAGANIKVTVKVNWPVNDDAEFGKDIAIETHIEQSTFGGAKGSNGSFVDFTQSLSSLPGGKNGESVNRTSSKATKDDVAIAKAAAQLAQLAAMATMYQAKEAFQSGRCVKLVPTSDPSKRSGVKPSTSFALLAPPRSKIDGTPTGGTVKAELSGAGSLDPAGTKVPADAKFTYVAPGEKNKKGTVSFEARSKRGVGKATLDFDTNNRAYLADGGADAYHGTGQICDLSQPFEISGSGVTNKFTPSSPTAGSYSYSGSIAGFAVWGSGTYTVKADESGGTLIAKGPGSVKTPMGVKSNTGAEIYKLTPLESCTGK